MISHYQDTHTGQGDHELIKVASKQDCFVANSLIKTGGYDHGERDVRG